MSDSDPKRTRKFHFDLSCAFQATHSMLMAPCKAFVFLFGLFFLLTCSTFLWAAEPSPSLPTKPQDEPLELDQIRTILVTGSVKSWLEGDQPVYTVVITLKLKLQDAGFKVVFDPTLSHDANLRIQYEEYPSGQFQLLEQATALTYTLQLVHPHLGVIFSREFEASPNPIPVASLYWDTISNLEENPYYYFLGEILWGRLHHDMNDQESLLKVLMKPYSHSTAPTISHSRNPNETAVLQRARLNAINELGQGSFKTSQARDTLWKLAKDAHPNERQGAITQLGIIGDSSILSDLKDLMEKEMDPEVQSATQQAIRLIESR